MLYEVITEVEMPIGLYTNYDQGIVLRLYF